MAASACHVMYKIGEKLNVVCRCLDVWSEKWSKEMNSSQINSQKSYKWMCFTVKPLTKRTCSLKTQHCVQSTVLFVCWGNRSPVLM